MKQAALYVILFFLTCLSTRAQAYEDKVQYDKKKQQAIAIEYSYPPEAVENAFVDRFRQMGYKAKEEKGIFNSDKGFLVFKNAYVTEISKDRLDYIIRIDRKSRKESDESVLYLILYKDDTNALEKMESFSVGNAKAFLNNMLPYIEAANLELQIRDQEEVVSRAEKRLKQLQDEKLDLDRKIVDNQKNQDETIKDIELQKNNLELLKGKRKKE